MNIEHLKYLVTVADCGSIHEASRQLLLKQQYVSNVMKSLERYFDVQIFERQSKGVVPTANGQYLIDKARKILMLFDDMEASYQYPDNQKQLDCTESITLYLPAYLDSSQLIDALDTFNSYFPNVNVSLISHGLDETLPTQLTVLNSLFLYPSSYSTEQFENKLPAELTYQTLHSVSLMLYAAKTNPLAQKYSVISIEKALTLPLALLIPRSTDISPVYQILQSYGTPNVQYMVDNPMLLFRMLQKKNCFTIAKPNILEGDNTIVRIPFEKPIQFDLRLIYHPDTLKSYAVRSLIKLMKNQQKGITEYSH